MNLQELIAEARANLDDREAPHLWSDDDLRRYANEAAEEAAKRTCVITEKDDDAYCAITISAGLSWYALHPKVVQVVSAKLVTAETNVHPVKMEEVVYRYGQYWERVSGTPRYLVQDDSNRIMLVPKPVMADTLRLVVNRLPKQPMTSMEDTPEILSRYHGKLVFYMCHRAYEKNDSETKNLEESQYWREKFEAIFGKPVSIAMERSRRAPVPRRSGYI